MDNLYSNPLVQRIQGGTVDSSRDLCRSCRYCLQRQSAVTGDTELRCAQLPNFPVIKTRIAACTFYTEKGKLNLNEMVDIAWVVEERGKKIGFLSPEELERRRRDQPPCTPHGF